MFIKIPFESEIKFKTNIFEITKMSLEHDYNVNDGEVLGNFYISGEYRTHEVSVNLEPFNYTIPFNVSLRDDIDKDTIEFNIEDFSYNIIDDKVLKINIEYSLKGEIKEKELFERVDEVELESELAYIDNFLENPTDVIEQEEVKLEEIPDEEVKEKVVENIKKEETSKEEVKEDIKVEENPKEEIVVEDVRKEDNTERLSIKEEKTVMETIKNSDDTFVTYHLHIVKENETIESICQAYKIPNSLISEYNDIENITIGDKILIPKLDE